MNNVVTTQAQSQSIGLLNLEAFELSQRIAKMLSSSSLVPEQYRQIIKVRGQIQPNGTIRYKDEDGNFLYRDEPNPNGLANCVIALNMASRLNADPLMVMQNLYLIEGRPAWSSQFIMAAINSCGRFSALRFEIEDLGEKEVEYTDTKWENRKKITVTKKIKIHDMSCVAFTIERETGERIESSKISIEMAVKEGWFTKNGSKWQTMPEQMLRYRAAAFFGRVYAPELLMGLRSAEEETERKEIDVTPTQNIVATQQDTTDIKQQILKAKTLDELDAISAELDQLPEQEKNELDKLLNAQYKKYSETATAKKAEVAAEEKPVNTEVAKKKSSLELRKEMLIQINSFTHASDLKVILQHIENNPDLSDVHKTYLQNAVKQKMTELESSKSTSDEQLAGQLNNAIENAKNIDELTQVAARMRDSKNTLSSDVQSKLMETYRLRKEFLENQQDMFVETNWIDGAIERIKAAAGQDAINAEYSDPAYEQLSSQDKQRLDAAAQQRESELFG